MEEYTEWNFCDCCLMIEKSDDLTWTDGQFFDDEKDAIFMAGSPGAGKSEVALGLVNSYHKHLIIDADEFRLQFPEYNGSNSSLFQKASSWLVDQAFKYVINHGYSFILDATFAILSAEKNITRAMLS